MIKDGLIVVVTCCVFAFFCDASRNAATGGTMSSSKTFVRSHKKQQDSLIKIFDGTKDKHSSHGFTAPSNEDGVVPYFLRSFDQLDPDSIIADKIPSWLAGMSHYRLLPGFFPEVVKYHFDGLATVAKFEVNSDASTIHLSLKPFASKLESNFENCIFMGTGTGPTLGDELCVQNPGVNLLPIQSQLWLTIDTSAWGRVDPSSLETIQGAKVNVSSQVLNAHPACDRSKNICYVQHPCPKTSPPPPLSDQVCYSILKPQSGDAADMETTIISRVTLKEEKLIQHSHSPCLTQNWVVSKLDSFEPRLKSKGNAGVLKLLHQSEDSLWLIMDRRTNKSVVMESDIKFVNNHFWNCVEDKTDGSIIVDTVAATEDYLDTYFQHNLNGTVQWDDIFHPPLRCRIPTNGTSNIVCSNLLEEEKVFDYPTFNPLFKMNPNYQYFYGIAAKNKSKSRWFDEAVKVHVSNGSIAARWSSPGIFLTEFDFIPRTNSTDPQDEDDGALITILYNKTADTSILALFDPSSLRPIAMHSLRQVFPFHAHGIVCRSGEHCFSNP